VVIRAVSVSVAVDLDTYLVFAVVWQAWWAVRGDETIGAVDARVVLAVGSGSTFDKVLAVRVRGAADILANVVSAKSSLQWPATMIVGSALLFYTHITKAEAFAIGALLDISLASLVSDAIWSPAGIRRLVAELIMFAVSFGCALDVNTFLFDALVSFKTGVREGVSAMVMLSAFLWNTLARLAKRVLVTVRLISTVNGEHIRGQCSCSVVHSPCVLCTRQGCRYLVRHRYQGFLRSRPRYQHCSESYLGN